MLNEKYPIMKLANLNEHKYNGVNSELESVILVHPKKLLVGFSASDFNPFHKGTVNCTKIPLILNVF